MKFGANSFVWTDLFGPENFDLLPRMKAAGFDGIEIGMLAPVNFAAAATRRELEKSDLECTSCCVIPKGASLISEDKESRIKAQNHIAACLRATAEAGGKLMCGPLYSPVGYFTGVRRTGDEWKRAVEGWQELALVAETVGVEVALEPLNRFESYFLNTVDDAARLCDEIDNKNIGILVDTFHSNI
jgi:D-psicose/D-tagatose/L-ribulose 3-epimerase